jgi:peroxiredoxin
LSEYYSRNGVVLGLCLVALMQPSLAACQSIIHDKLQQSSVAGGTYKPFAIGSLSHMETWEKPLPVPNILITDTSGADVNLSATPGQAAILYVWAMWASPSAKELPQLVALQNRYQVQGLTVLALSVDAPDQSRKVAGVAKAFSPLKVYEAKDMSQTYERLGITSLPAAIVIDNNHQEIARLQGPTNWDSAEVSAFLDAILSPVAKPVN